MYNNNNEYNVNCISFILFITYEENDKQFHIFNLVLFSNNLNKIKQN